MLLSSKLCLSFLFIDIIVFILALDVGCLDHPTTKYMYITVNIS